LKHIPNLSFISDLLEILELFFIDTIPTVETCHKYSGCKQRVSYCSFVPNLVGFSSEASMVVRIDRISRLDYRFHRLSKSGHFFQIGVKTSFNRPRLSGWDAIGQKKCLSDNVTSYFVHPLNSPNKIQAANTPAQTTREATKDERIYCPVLPTCIIICKFAK